MKELREEEVKGKNKIIQEKDRVIGELESKLRKYDQTNGQFQVFEQKFNDLSKQANELAAALQHSRES